MGMMLSKLLPTEQDLPDLAVCGITDDSRMVKVGDLFIAIPGLNVDGRDYILDVERKNAIGVLCEFPAPEVDVKIPVLPVVDLRLKVGELASQYFGEPSQRLLVVAVTGTNGKTSCTQFISQSLSHVGQKSAVIGTMGYGALGKQGESENLEATGLTTPGPIELQKYLLDLVNQDCTAVAIEASSHGLEQGRLNATNIDIAVFTNVTRDHLDYHEGFESYCGSKQKLFEMEALQHAVINRDDKFGLVLINKLAGQLPLLTTSIEDAKADIYCSNIRATEKGLNFKIHSPWGELQIKSPLVGRFNLSNILSAVAVLGIQGYGVKDIGVAISALKPVTGRMEVIRQPGKPTVIIDYAHTPDALEKALLAVKEHFRGEIWCVFGCGGNRDKGKRGQMGEIASRNANHVMITDDNPRFETSMAIANDIIKGVVSGSDVEVQTDRTHAIQKVLLNAAARDVVLIAGKGHEQYQEVDGKNLNYSDHQVVNRILGQAG